MTVRIPDDLLGLLEQARSHEGATSLVIYHRDGAQVVGLSPGLGKIVGREPPADVPIRDHSLSRQHARFEVIDGELWIEDLGSTNGTWINGARVSRSRARPGDELMLGSVVVLVHALSPKESALYGLPSHDRFLSRLEEEAQRCRVFNRRMALLMVRAARGGEGHLCRWCPRVRALLRSVDRVGLYGPDVMEILLPESGASQVQTLTEAILAGRLEGEPSLQIGFGIYPDGARTIEALIDHVWSAVQRATLALPVVAVADTAEAGLAFPLELGGVGAPVVHNETMRDLFTTAERLGHTGIPVLIAGETGVGKELLALAIHRAGPRRARRLCSLNCGAIPPELIEATLFGHERAAFTGASEQRKGIFEQADGGTLFFDEIGELPPKAQVALLRALEGHVIRRVGGTKEIDVDVRVIAATNQDLEAMCHAGTFRSDLLYRLNAMTLRVPPLRERPEEIGPLAESFLEEANELHGRQLEGLTPAAAAWLLRYGWPGNVRELRNVIHRAAFVAQGTQIDEDDLLERVRGRGSATSLPAIPSLPPQPGDEDLDFRTRLERYQIHLLADALEQSGWNQTEAARRLRIPLRTLVHKIRVFGIRKPVKKRK
ncbi:MAG: sigma 54-interacting transcriptional regulator [Deltaproteobacteria bacterium]|nr:sigma 54-interacting transcriptional regulator [Deltaproteobacteria bacterium]